MAETPTSADIWHKRAQTIGIFVSILGSTIAYCVTWAKEIEARKAAETATATARKIEARRPFLDLRQQRYVEIGQVVATLVASPPSDPENETIRKARQRFRELYIIELSMVESPVVEAEMKALAKQIDPTLVELDRSQRRALDLAHALRDSFSGDFGLELPPPEPTTE